MTTFHNKTLTAFLGIAIIVGVGLSIGLTAKPTNANADTRIALVDKTITVASSYTSTNITTGCSPFIRSGTGWSTLGLELFNPRVLTTAVTGDALAYAAIPGLANLGASDVYAVYVKIYGFQSGASATDALMISALDGNGNTFGASATNQIYNPVASTVTLTSDAITTANANPAELPLSSYSTPIKGVKIWHYSGSQKIIIYRIVITYVTPLNYVPVTGVTLNRSSTTLAVGGTETLTATVSPANATNQSVSWSSANASITSVNSSGVVNGVAQGGPINITVTTASYSLMATCQVTVTSYGYSYNFISGALGLSGSPLSSVTLGTLNWNTNYTWKNSGAKSLGWDAVKGVQIGDSGNPASLVLSTANDLSVSGSNAVVSLLINASIGVGGTSALSVYVGGSIVGTTQTLTSSASEYVFTLSSATPGKVSISLYNSGTQAVYLKTIKVFANVMADTSAYVTSSTTGFQSFIGNLDTCSVSASLVQEMIGKYHSLLTSAQGNVASLTVSDTYNAITSDVNVMTKYDFIIAHRALVDGSVNALNAATLEESALLPILIISIVGLTLIIGYFILKKKKDD